MKQAHEDECAMLELKVPIDVRSTLAHKLVRLAFPRADTGGAHWLTRPCAGGSRHEFTCELSPARWRGWHAGTAEGLAGRGEGEAPAAPRPINFGGNWEMHNARSVQVHGLRRSSRRPMELRCQGRRCTNDFELVRVELVQDQCGDRDSADKPGHDRGPSDRAVPGSRQVTV